MDESKINQPEINLNSIVGEAKANLYTGRLLYCMNEVEIGLDSYSINLSHIYNSQYDSPEGVEKHFSNKWKLNVEQYVYKENGNYYYIDANGSIIKFEELETDVYYDTSGLGFTLVKLEDCIEIKDPSDSKMIFRDGKLIEIVSSVEQSMIKKFVYENEKLISIYDNRKPDTRIELSYSENSFLQEVIVIVKNKIQYKLKYYYENNNLMSISKIESGFEKEYILINYDINNYIKTIAYIDSGDALRFLYNEDNKINQIINGVIDINKFKKSEKNICFIEDLYVEEQKYAGDKENKYSYIIGENIDVLNFNKIEYVIDNSNHLYSIVENEKNIKLAYYINDNGYLISILEINGSIYELKTLEKKPGKSMLNEGCGIDSEEINTQKAILVNTRTIISTDENGLMSGRLASLDEYRKNEYSVYENYICSFWIKLLEQLDNSKVKLRIVSNKEEDADESIVTIDNTAIMRWQEVRIPIKITHNCIKSISLEFLDEGQAKNLKIVDMKLYYSFTNKTMITNGITPAYLDDVTFIKYKRKNNNNYSLLTFDDDTFITEKDLQMMYLSKFKSTNNEFKFFYNDCTKCVLVNEVILNALNTDYNIEFNDDNYTEIFNISNSRAQFFNESLSPDGDLYVYQIPYYVKNYEIDGEQHNCMILITEANRYLKENPDGSTPSEHIESYMMKCIDLNGKILFEQDEYGVQNIYKYDHYGTLISKILTSNKQNGERITENIVSEFNEDNNSSIYATKKIINNYNFTNYIYNEKGNLISSEVSSENTQDIRKKEYKYTLFDNKIKTIKNNNGEITNIKYNAKGNITEISPKKVNGDDYYSYKFQYDKFGNPNKLIYSYKDNGQEINKTLITKNIDKENNTITTEYYNNEVNPDKVTVLMNKYGNIENMDINGNKVTFTRQNLWESSGAANVEKIVDELDGKEYFYNYDDFNKLINYGYKDSKKDLIIQKDDNNDIRTKINCPYGNDSQKYLSIKSTNTFDSNNLFNPRISETIQLCVSTSFSDRVQYTYDELGRIKSIKRPSLYYLNGIVNSFEEFNYLDKSNYIANKSVVTKFYDDKCNHYFNSTYNEFGNVTSNNLKIEKNADDEDEKQELNYSRIYKYSKAGRIIEEFDTLNNIKIEYSYNNDGSIDFCSVNGIKRNYNYDKGRLTSITEGGQINNTITYDNIGNISQIGINEYKWERGNLLSEFKCLNDRINFYYNGFGQKQRKILPNGVEINYVYDKDKLIGEYHSNGEYLIYTYDNMGVTGFWYNRIDSERNQYLEEYYYYIKDIQNNVRSIMFYNEEVAHYEYDCYGNCVLINYTDKNIGNINPIRWKSMYCEIGCNLYFINNSTYSPELKQNVSMITFDDLINIEFKSNNLYAYQLITTNSFDLVYYQSDIDSQLELSYKPLSIPKWSTFLSELWKTTGGKLLAIFLTGLALVLSIAMFGLAGLIGFGITAAVVATSLIVGSIMAGIAGRKVGKGFYNGFINYLNENWSQTLGTQMLMYVVSISILKITTDCFVEGTLVLASTGQVKIEEVKVGDEVWSFNHQTGKKELKKVKHIFRNKTKEWYHLYIFNQKTSKEEKITCTKNHRIYIKNKGYVVANKILEKDKVILYNGMEGLITRIEIEELEEEQTTYNFEVEDNHNYYVSEECVLVHNDCKRIDIDVCDEKKALDEANKMIGENPKIIYKKGQEFYVSEDGLRTWRKDFHGSVKPYRAPQSHINVEIWKKSFYEIGRNRKIKNIHIWYGGN